MRQLQSRADHRSSILEFLEQSGSNKFRLSRIGAQQNCPTKLAQFHPPPAEENWAELRTMKLERFAIVDARKTAFLWYFRNPVNSALRLYSSE